MQPNTRAVRGISSGFFQIRVKVGRLAAAFGIAARRNRERSLAGFRWQCSARVWAYTLARHAASRYARESRRHRAAHVPLSGALAEIAEPIRTATLVSARTETKSRLRLLRERLPAADQALLILRVNRALTWTEIAQVLLHDVETADQALLAKEAARLRKRYQAAKDKLLTMALAEGLVSRK
jgi:RNA polymerase sigma-70 factor (ECF subfamily)